MKAARHCPAGLRLHCSRCWPQTLGDCLSSSLKKNIRLNHHECSRDSPSNLPLSDKKWPRRQHKSFKKNTFTNSHQDSLHVFWPKNNPAMCGYACGFHQWRPNKKGWIGAAAKGCARVVSIAFFCVIWVYDIHIYHIISYHYIYIYCVYIYMIYTKIWSLYIFIQYTIVISTIRATRIEYLVVESLREPWWCEGSSISNTTRSVMWKWYPLVNCHITMENHHF